MYKSLVFGDEFLAQGLHLKFNPIKSKIICIELFTIQSLQSNFTGNEVSKIDLYIVETQYN